MKIKEITSDKIIACVTFVRNLGRQEKVVNFVGYKENDVHQPDKNKNK